MVRAPGSGDGGAPGRARGPGERIEHAAVGNHDEPERPRVAPAEARPLGRPVGGPGELGGEGALGGPGDGRHPPDLDGGRRLPWRRKSES